MASPEKMDLIVIPTDMRPIWLASTATKIDPRIFHFFAVFLCVTTYAQHGKTKMSKTAERPPMMERIDTSLGKTRVIEVVTARIPIVTIVFLWN